MPRTYPWPRVQEHVPTILSLESQRRILDAIPEARRGPFLAMALLGIRPSEVCDLEMRDYRDGWLSIRESKTNRGDRLPAPEELARWIEQNISLERRMQGGPLFRIPYRGTGKRPRGPWSWTTLNKVWRKACAETGVVARMHEGTKHTFATHLDADERVVQAILRHKDAQSTRRYRRLKDQAVLEALRPRTRD